MNKKIVILVTIAVVVVGGAILLKGYINPYSSTGDKNASVDIPKAGNEINIQNFAFSPATLNTQVGVKVVWRQNDQVVHKIVSSEGLFSSGDLKSGDEFSFVFTEAGEYDYYCSLHPSMRGKIIVK